MDAGAGAFIIYSAQTITNTLVKHENTKTADNKVNENIHTKIRENKNGNLSNKAEHFNTNSWWS